jgi:signal transduction histidine kinase
VKTNLALATSNRARRSQPRISSRAPAAEVDLVVQLAHDLRSPLSGIMMLAESLRNGLGGPVNESQRRQLDMIYGAAFSLCANASDVVELAHDGAGLADEMPEHFSVTEVLRGVRDMVSPLAAGKNLELRIVLPVRDRRNGCARALTRVLLNLTTNALKCTERGVVELVAREVEGHADRLEFSVRDTGPGLRPEVVRAVDEARRDRVGSRRNCLTSSGHGLAMCRKLMQKMCSALHVETSAHDGTRFYFELFVPCV